MPVRATMYTNTNTPTNHRARIHEYCVHHDSTPSALQPRATPTPAHRPTQRIATHQPDLNGLHMHRHHEGATKRTIHTYSPWSKASDQRIHSHGATTNRPTRLPTLSIELQRGSARSVSWGPPAMAGYTPCPPFRLPGVLSATPSHQSHRPHRTHHTTGVPARGALGDRQQATFRIIDAGCRAHSHHIRDMPRLACCGAPTNMRASSTSTAHRQDELTSAGAALQSVRGDAVQAPPRLDVGRIRRASNQSSTCGQPNGPPSDHTSVESELDLADENWNMYDRPTAPMISPSGAELQESRDEVRRLCAEWTPTVISRCLQALTRLGTPHVRRYKDSAKPALDQDLKRLIGTVGVTETCRTASCDRHSRQHPSPEGSYALQRCLR